MYWNALKRARKSTNIYQNRYPAPSVEKQIPHNKQTGTRTRRNSTATNTTLYHEIEQLALLSHRSGKAPKQNFVFWHLCSLEKNNQPFDTVQLSIPTITHLPIIGVLFCYDDETNVPNPTTVFRVPCCTWMSLPWMPAIHQQVPSGVISIHIG